MKFEVGKLEFENKCQPNTIILQELHRVPKKVDVKSTVSSRIRNTRHYAYMRDLIECIAYIKEDALSKNEIAFTQNEKNDILLIYDAVSQLGSSLGYEI